MALTGSVPEFDPRSGKWLDIKLPFGMGYFSIVPHKAYVNAIARGVLGKKEGEYGSEDPFLQRVEAATGFASGRVGQIPGMLTDIIRNEEFGGRRIYTPGAPVGQQLGEVGGYIGKTMSPIVAQNVLDDLSRSEAGAGIGVRGTIGVTGLNVRPLSMTDQLSQISRAAFGKDWRD